MNDSLTWYIGLQMHQEDPDILDELMAVDERIDAIMSDGKTSEMVAIEAVFREMK